MCEWGGGGGRRASREESMPAGFCVWSECNHIGTAEWRGCGETTGAVVVPCDSIVAVVVTRPSKAVCGLTLLLDKVAVVELGDPMAGPRDTQTIGEEEGVDVGGDAHVDEEHSTD